MGGVSSRLSLLALEGNLCRGPRKRCLPKVSDKETYEYEYVKGMLARGTEAQPAAPSRDSGAQAACQSWGGEGHAPGGSCQLKPL